MFRPHKGICTCHEQERWILNKKGECQNGINERKQTKKNKGTSVQRKSHLRTHRPIPKKYVLRNKKPLAKKVKKATGEAVLFLQIWEKALEQASPSCPTCVVCKAPLGYEPRTFYFSHVLAKGTFGLFRLWKPNIWIECLTCHQDWDQGDRSQQKFIAKRKFAERIKKFYYQVKDKINYKLPEKFEP